MRQKIFRTLVVSTLLGSFSLNAEEETLRKGAYFYAAPVYWQAEGNGLAFAVSTDGSRSSVKNLDFDWDFGFEIGLGYRIPHDLWSFSLGLKHVHNNAYGEERAKGGELLFPTWSLPGSTGPVDRIHAHWRLHLGLLDFLLARKWEISRWISFEPHLGIRSAWIRQKYNIEYGGDLSPSEESFVRMKNKFWGLGPAFGMQGNWEVIRHFSLFGDLLVSFLYGQFYLHQDEDTFAKVKLLGLHSTFKSSAWTADISAGIRWAHAYRGVLKRVAVEIAWDQIFLYQQNQLIRFTNSMPDGAFVSNQGDLSLTGIHIGARFDF